MKEKSNKKFSKLCRWLDELMSDKSILTSKSYVRKLEKMLNLFAELYILPDLQGIDDLCEIVYDEKDGNMPTEDAKYRLGVADGETRTIVLYVGLLFDLPAISYQQFCASHNIELGGQLTEKQLDLFVAFNRRKRNEFVVIFMDSIAHESRHINQLRYLLYKESDNTEKKNLYLSMFGQDGDKIVGKVYKDELLEKPVLNIISFLIESGDLHVDEKLSLNKFKDEEINYILYFKQPDEKDAREYSHEKIRTFKQDLVKYMQEENVGINTLFHFIGYLKTRDTLKMARYKKISKKLYKFCNRQDDVEYIMEKRERFVDNWIRSAQQYLMPSQLVEYLKHVVENEEIANVLNEFYSILHNRLLKNIFEDEKNVSRLKEMLQEDGLDVFAQMIEGWQENSLPNYIEEL